jgi:transposase
MFPTCIGSIGSNAVVVAAKGREGVQQLVTAVAESSDERLPSHARFACQAIVAQLHAAQTQIHGLDKRITQAHRANAESKRLDTIPGFGVILSTAVVATTRICRVARRRSGKWKP